MSTNHKLASGLFHKYPDVISRGAAAIPLQEGDLVTDAGFANLPMLVDDSTGRIIARHGSVAKVEWRTGEREEVHVANLVRVKENYIPEFHESAYDLPKFSPGTRVVLGNGDSARVVEKVTGPTGFHSFRVQIEKSANPLTVGRRVYATPDGMYRIAGLAPDIVACFYKEGKLSPKATIGCEIMVDDIDQQVGLQKYSSLPQDDGMLFPYEPPRRVTFHMGSVQFPIDVIFVGPHGRIAAIEENCEPGFEQHWTHGRVSAVIEVNGGWCAERNIVEGDLVRLSNTRRAFDGVVDPEENRIFPDGVNRDRQVDVGKTLTQMTDGKRFEDRSIPADQQSHGVGPVSGGDVATQGLGRDQASLPTGSKPPKSTGNSKIVPIDGGEYDGFLPG